MAQIYRTTLQPGKAELIAAWLPGRPWYVGSGDPVITPAGGFRLDDPAGEVGIEFFFARDSSVDAVYNIPLAYRGAPLDGADAGLVGTTEHGVLGTRWVYDGAYDPVVIATLLSFVQGETAAQMQRVSDTADPSVRAQSSRPGSIVMVGMSMTSDRDGTTVAVETAADEVAPAGAVAVRLIRRLGEFEADEAFFGDVVAPWLQPDRTSVTGPVVLVS